MKYLSFLLLLVISNLCIAQVTVYFPPNIQWQKCIGGTNEDTALNIEQTIDGGYIVSGRTNSIDGDFVGNSGNSFCLVKLDGNGNISWKRFFPAMIHDHLKEEMHHTTDGGFIIGGDTVRKLDANGNTVWILPQKRPLIKQTFDGGYIAVEQYGMWYDYLATKIDASGNIQWFDTAGGPLDFYVLYSIEQYGDSTFLYAGTGEWGGLPDDFATIARKKLNEQVFDFATFGDGVFYYIKRTLDGGMITISSGGSLYRFASNATLTWLHAFQFLKHTIQNQDSSFTACGYKQGQALLMNLQPTSDSMWAGYYGGTFHDDFIASQQTTDGGYIAVGNTLSNDGDVSGNHGGRDIWVVKFGPDSMAVLNINTLQATNAIHLYPNPTKGNFTITTPEDGKVELYDMQGRLLYTTKIPKGKTDIKMPSNISAGTYLLRYNNADGNIVENKMLIYQP